MLLAGLNRENRDLPQILCGFDRGRFMYETMDWDSIRKQLNIFILQ